jgi:hypothetical protein
LAADSRILEATWVRAPVPKRETSSQTSSSTARKSAVVAESNMGSPSKERYDYRNKRAAEFNSVYGAHRIGDCNAASVTNCSCSYALFQARSFERRCPQNPNAIHDRDQQKPLPVFPVIGGAPAM